MVNSDDRIAIFEKRTSNSVLERDNIRYRGIDRVGTMIEPNLIPQTDRYHYHINGARPFVLGGSDGSLCCSVAGSMTTTAIYS